MAAHPLFPLLRRLPQAGAPPPRLGTRLGPSCGAGLALAPHHPHPLFRHPALAPEPPSPRLAGHCRAGPCTELPTSWMVWGSGHCCRCAELPSMSWAAWAWGHCSRWRAWTTRDAGLCLRLGAIARVERLAPKHPRAAHEGRRATLARRHAAAGPCMSLTGKRSASCRKRANDVPVLLQSHRILAAAGTPEHRGKQTPPDFELPSQAPHSDRGTWAPRAARHFRRCLRHRSF